MSNHHHQIFDMCQLVCTVIGFAANTMTMLVLYVNYKGFIPTCACIGMRLCSCTCVYGCISLIIDVCTRRTLYTVYGI